MWLKQAQLNPMVLDYVEQKGASACSTRSATITTTNSTGGD
jgi:hypothetical protein